MTTLSIFTFTVAGLIRLARGHAVVNDLLEPKVGLVGFLWKLCKTNDWKEVEHALWRMSLKHLNQRIPKKGYLS